ncbi:hypothetical protein B0T26DRAFT_109276 [Lasiosphaeria miniovina]|uniref:Uncharacterized protein n=1 Tax=Lasiosphaeria miniovina TaxID=1954250 RepID=A0AA40B3C2_9PEZI|nr:uncharacterized protein B0T26DRAFT_109276 [Lasiosphaeria miniovina]KAK0726943.1 hypothetical protein B0T26DRAFT_109276 [Lasiosphaeria miniovina]
MPLPCWVSFLLLQNTKQQSPGLPGCLLSFHPHAIVCADLIHLACVRRSTLASREVTLSRLTSPASPTLQLGSLPEPELFAFVGTRYKTPSHPASPRPLSSSSHQPCLLSLASLFLSSLASVSEHSSLQPTRSGSFKNLYNSSTFHRSAFFGTFSIQLPHNRPSQPPQHPIHTIKLNMISATAFAFAALVAMTSALPAVPCATPTLPVNPSGKSLASALPGSWRWTIYRRRASY